MNPVQSVAVVRVPQSPNWAEHLIYMEAGAELPAAPSSREPERRAGIVVCAALALTAFGIERALAINLGRGLDAAMLAMLLGLVVTNTLPGVEALRDGSRWVVRVVLPLGIALLGVRLQLGELAGLGLRGLAFGVGTLAAVGAVVWLLTRWRRVSARLALLLAVGTGICGGSAIVATAPVIGADEDEIAVSVATVALLGLVAMLLLPPLAAALGMTPEAFGLWSGLTIHQTPQVVAAGFAYGPEAGEIATVVKLARVSLLAPVVLAIGLLWRRSAQSGGTPPSGVGGLVPGFLIGLVVLAGAATLGLLPTVSVQLPGGSLLAPIEASLDTRALAGDVSKVCLVASMAAVGLETRWRALRRAGPAALAIGAGASFATAGLLALLLTR